MPAGSSSCAAAHGGMVMLAPRWLPAGHVPVMPAFPECARALPDTVAAAAAPGPSRTVRTRRPAAVAANQLSPADCLVFDTDGRRPVPAPGQRPRWLMPRLAPGRASAGPRPGPHGHHARCRHWGLTLADWARPA